MIVTYGSEDDDDSKMGILLNNLVPASMSTVMHETYAAYKPTKIISCKCNCACGAEVHEALVDLHVLQLGLELLFLLTGSLVEHISLELSARMKSVAEGAFKDDEIVEMKKSILALLIAAGHDSAKVVDLDVSINDILSSFSVGTEKRKNNTAGAPDPMKIGPISELENGSLVSNKRNVAIKMGRVKDCGKCRK